MSLDLMNCVLYVIHNAAESTLKVRRDWNKSCKMKRIQPLFPSHGFYWVCAEQNSGHLTHRAGAWAGITALHFEIGFTESLVLPALATVLKRTDSICATSWVDLSLLASVSFGERLWRREHNTFPCLFLYYMVCFSQTYVCLFVSFWAKCTMVEVFGKVLLRKNGCGQVKSSVFVKVCQTAF